MFVKSILPALIASIAIGSLPATESAEDINPNINVSESELRTKCNSAGGSFTKYSDGTYGCIVNAPDGTLTTVSCDADQSCTGTSGTRKIMRDRKAKARQGGMVVLGVEAPTSVKKHRVLRGTQPAFK